MASDCGSRAMPAGFQYIAEASFAAATNAPPIPTARAPTGMLRNLPPVVPTLVTSWLRLLPEYNNIRRVIQFRNFWMRFTLCSFSSRREASFNHRELPDFLSDNTGIDVIDIDAVRDRQIVPREKIPLGGAVQDIAVVIDGGDQLAAHRVNPDRTVLRQMIKMDRPRTAARGIRVPLFPGCGDDIRVRHDLDALEIALRFFLAHRLSARFEFEDITRREEFREHDGQRVPARGALTNRIIDCPYAVRWDERIAEIPLQKYNDVARRPVGLIVRPAGAEDPRSPVRIKLSESKFDLFVLTRVEDSEVDGLCGRIDDRCRPVDQILGRSAERRGSEYNPVIGRALLPDDLAALPLPEVVIPDPRAIPTG